MNNINDLLDSSWIANILSISFSLIIFLLGLPVLFIQTYVPENLRGYYHTFLVEHKRKLNISVIILVLIILIFGNHGVKFSIVYFFAKEPLSFFLHSEYLGSLTANEIIFLDYIISLLIFLIISGLIYRNFINTVFDKKNPSEVILNNFFFNPIKHGKLNEHEIIQLIDFGIVYKNNSSRKKFLLLINDLIVKIVSSDNYKGEETKVIFSEVLYPIFIKEHANCSYFDIDNVIRICSFISLSNNTQKKYSLTNYDQEFITESFLFELSILLINSENISLARKCIIVLKQFNSVESVFFKIYYTAFDKKIFSLLEEEIKEILIYIVTEKVHTYDYISKKYNLIAYLSFFYSENIVMKERVSIWMKFLAEKNIIFVQDDFTRALSHFVKVSKYDTAFKIQTLRDNYNLQVKD